MKISGRLNNVARILVIDMASWSVESNTEGVFGNYTIEGLSSGEKVVAAISNNGETLVFGSVTPKP